MVWGCICAEGTVDIVWMHENINSNLYEEEILEKRVKLFAYLEKDGIFQQDNARPHTAQKIKDWFQKEKIELLEWPAQSPDLSPIENIWAWIKHNVWEKQKNIKTQEDLWEFVQNIWWSENLKKICQNADNSMPDRINEVILQKGGPTSY